MNCHLFKLVWRGCFHYQIQGKSAQIPLPINYFPSYFNNLGRNSFAFSIVSVQDNLLIIKDLEKYCLSVLISSHQISPSLIWRLKFNKSAEILVQKQLATSLKTHYHLTVLPNSHACYLIISHMILLWFKAVFWGKFQQVAIRSAGNKNQVLFRKMIKSYSREVSKILIVVLISEFEFLFIVFF